MEVENVYMYISTLDASSKCIYRCQQSVLPPTNAMPAVMPISPLYDSR